MKKVYFVNIKYAVVALVWMFCAFTNTLCAQTNQRVDYYHILDQIEEGMQEGNTMVLRDAALLLERVSVKARALKLLKRYTLFTPREFTFSEYTTKYNFLNFFYENQDRIKYSIPLEAFYITPLEERNLAYKVELVSVEEQANPSGRLREHIQLFERAIETEDEKIMKTQIERIGQLNSLEADQYLLSLLKQKAFKRKYAQLTKLVVEELTYYKSIESVNAILSLFNDSAIPKVFLLDQLAFLTNVKVKSAKDINRYAKLLDSLGSIDAVRQYGYEQYFPFKPHYFTEKVDYLGKILMTSDTLNWTQNNVVNDLLSSQHPRALYYLAAKTYRLSMNKDEGSIEAKELYAKMKAVLSIRLLITDKKQMYIEEPDWNNDFEAVQNYLHYWLAHYDDYEWDNYRNKFINKTLSLTLEKRYKLYIRQLTSVNDSVAWYSYLQLTEGKPNEIIKLVERFRPILDNHNKNLPPIEYAYLERLSELTDFCKRNDILYQPTTKINGLIDSLMLNVKPKIRYQLEKRLAQTVNINDLTALEYQACLYVANEQLMYSLAWVLDRSYTKYWDEILNDDKQLRLYLKKSYLFNRLGADGICNVYLNKLNASSDEKRARLKQLLLLETDPDIIQQARRILVTQTEEKLYTWKDLLTTDFDMMLLAVPTKKEIENIYRTIYDSEEERIQLKLIFYLSLHPNIYQVPFLYRLLQKNLLEQEAIALLERIYAYDFRDFDGEKKTAWLQYWESNQLQYRNWGTHFIERQINQLTTKNRISIYDVNDITQSPFYKEEYRNICLTTLQKVSPVRNIRRLNIEPKIKVATELRYLENIEFKTRDLLALLDVLGSDNNNKLLAFLIERTNDLSAKDRVFFYSKVIDSQWFTEYAEKEEIDEELSERLRKDFNKYLYNRRVSEKDKVKPNLALAKLEGINRPLNEQLFLTYNMPIDDKIKAVAQEAILKKATYFDLSDIMENYEELSTALNYNVLHERFGLPIFDLSDPRNQEDIKRNLKELTPNDFYRFYLKAFGVDFEDEKGKLDFDKIFKLLKYDIVYPFASSTNPRNYYVNGLIRVLEIYFETDLGFPKYFGLENPPTGKSIRAYTWMMYLEKKRNVKEKETIPNSFTYSYLQRASS